MVLHHGPGGPGDFGYKPSSPLLYDVSPVAEHTLWMDILIGAGLGTKQEKFQL